VYPLRGSVQLGFISPAPSDRVPAARPRQRGSGRDKTLHVRWVSRASVPDLIPLPGRRGRARPHLDGSRPMPVRDSGRPVVTWMGVPPSALGTPPPMRSASSDRSSRNPAGSHRESRAHPPPRRRPRVPFDAPHLIAAAAGPHPDSLRSCRALTKRPPTSAPYRHSTVYCLQD